jgi:hypothetical protein
LSNLRSRERERERESKRVSPTSSAKWSPQKPQCQLLSDCRRDVKYPEDHPSETCDPPWLHHEPVSVEGVCYAAVKTAWVSWRQASFFKNKVKLTKQATFHCQF